MVYAKLVVEQTLLQYFQFSKSLRVDSNKFTKVPMDAILVV